MIVVDTNILSTFACVNRLELLFQVAETETLYLPPAVVDELSIGLSRGKSYLQALLNELQNGTTLKLITLTAAEIQFLVTLPNRLHAGEKEGIAVCTFRKKAVFLTNDKRASRYCDANHIGFLNLNRILRHLWQAGHCAKDEVRHLIETIEESEPGMVIKDQREIWR